MTSNERRKVMGLECNFCGYFAVTEDPEWKGRPHCCFHEWGHKDYETAPCDEPEYCDSVPNDYNGD